MLTRLKNAWSALTHKHCVVLSFNHPFSIVISKVFMDGVDITDYYRSINKFEGAIKLEGQPDGIHRNNSNKKDKKA